MTLPSSGSISASHIRDEFGPTTESGEQVALGEYRIDENYGELTERPLDDGIPQSGAISFQDFRGKKLNIIIDYYTSKYTDYTRENEGDNAMSIRNRFTSGTGVHVVGGYRSKPSSSSEIKTIVHVNRKLGGERANDATRCALRTGTGWEADTELVIDVGNEGQIYGAGGNGGQGGDVDTSGHEGQSGTSALGIQVSGTIVNIAGQAVIRAGFGGGGGGGAGRQNDKGSERTVGGGGGGGGQGYPAGLGGSEGNSDHGQGPGTNGSLNESGEGGGGGNNGNQAYSGAGGEGGQNGEAANDGAGANHGSGEGGGNGAAIRRTSGISVTINKTSGAEIVGSQTATGVS